MLSGDIQYFRDFRIMKIQGKQMKESFNFRAYANNRDGACTENKSVPLSWSDRKKIRFLIVLSDGKPCDMSIQRPGTRQPKIYDGEGAVKDTAYEVRRARNQGIFVIGIFVGNEEELSVEREFMEKTLPIFANISNFPVW